MSKISRNSSHMDAAFVIGTAARGDTPDLPQSRARLAMASSGGSQPTERMTSFRHTASVDNISI